MVTRVYLFFFFFQAEDGIRDKLVTGVQTCALPIWVDDGDGVGLVEAGQEKEVGALAELVVDVAVAAGLLRPPGDRESVAERPPAPGPPIRGGAALTRGRPGSWIAYNDGGTPPARAAEGGPLTS